MTTDATHSYTCYETFTQWIDEVSAYPGIAEQHAVLLPSDGLRLTWIPRTTDEDGLPAARILASIHGGESLATAHLAAEESVRTAIRTAAYEAIEKARLEAAAHQLRRAQVARDQALINASRRGLTQVVIAEALGVTQGRVSAMLSDIQYRGIDGGRDPEPRYDY